jgi:DNA polymerase V
MNVVALVDCNSFYVSCETIFKPHLKNKPVVVLSNNDGCVIARSSLAKKVGIKMGVPFFEVKKIVKQHNVKVFSSNYTLYANISSRVMGVLNNYCDELEVYSVDEAFLIFNKHSERSFFERARQIKKTVKEWIGIPVSIGIAENKTLSKIANHLAKKDELGTQIVELLDRRQIEIALKVLEVGDIWGIGNRISKFLQSNSIQTAYDLYSSDPRWIRQHLGVVGERTYRELHGEMCFPIVESPEAKKQCRVSRSFESYVENFKELEQRVVSYATRASEKIRSDQLQAKKITVFIRSNKFNQKNQPYYGDKTYIFISPTNDLFEIVKMAVKALGYIYKSGIKYKKAGVLLSDLSSEGTYNRDLFFQRSEKDILKKIKVNRVFDRLNSRYGSGTICVAKENYEKFYLTRRKNLSPAYTSSFYELPIVN